MFIEYLAEPIALICNLSFETGKFPSSFKKAIVCPIFKSGDKTVPSNYRPISLLSTLSKVLEKLVKKRLMKYLELNQLLSKNQYGFREARSTEDAVLMLSSLVTKYLDDGDKCMAVFLDLQKAFDTVSIPILLVRLENMGIRGVVLDWFTDYLKGRSQFVRVEGFESERANCTYGVPQGSTLGLALFLVYINQLCELIATPGLDILMFADDTVLIVHEKASDKLVKLAETSLANVTKWLENSLLSLNTGKTKYLCFSKSTKRNWGIDISIKTHIYPCNRTPQPHPNDCNCPTLSRVENIKYLGVIIDEKMNWILHIETLTSRIRKLIFAFKNLREVADFSLILQIYRALCECLLRYCVTVWGSAAKTNIIAVERAQRAVLKVLLRLPFRHPTTEVYEKANVLSVRKLFIYESIRRYHKKTIPTLPPNTKRVDRCPIPKVRNRFAQKHYSVITPHLYNKLNKKFKVKSVNQREIKKCILTWLKEFDYEDIESMLSNLYF